MNNKEGGLLFLGFVLCLTFLGYLGTIIYKNAIIDRECTGHLKRAADANTVELSKQELSVAVSYLEENKMTSGYTSILYTTPDEDLGFWYQNLKASLEELNAVKPDATQLEKSNVLLKLRETLLDEGQGSSVTHPAGIALFPHNTGFAIWGILGTILGFVGCCIIAVVLQG